MTKNEPASTAIVAVPPEVPRYFKADNCLRNIAGQTFTAYSNIGSWWGTCRITDPEAANQMAALGADPKNAVWEIDAEEYANLSQTVIEPGKRTPVPDKLAEKISANAAAMVTAEVIREDLAEKTTVQVDNVEDAVQVAEVARAQPKPKPIHRGRRGKDFNNLSVGSDVPRPNFNTP